MHRCDIVISSTASPLPIIGKGTVERALKERKYQPIFMVDLAVPRDVEPEVNQLDDVYLYSVDDLQSVIEENMENRQQAAEQAHEIIDSQVNHFLDCNVLSVRLTLSRKYDRTHKALAMKC